MESLFDQYNSYIDSLCANIIAETKAILKAGKDTNGRVYFCAISRKMPKFLDVLHSRLQDIWDKLYVFTEISLPFIDWRSVERMILADDAIYFGSTFMNIYHNIHKYAPQVEIVPICTIKASEVTLPFEKDLKTELVPRYVGHYFVNCLSIVFRKQCTPFEVEFPVFKISLPKGSFHKVVSSLRKNINIRFPRIYEIDNGISAILKSENADLEIAEFGVDFSEDNFVQKKLRIFCEKKNIYVSSICTYQHSQKELLDPNLFGNSSYHNLWLCIQEKIADYTKPQVYIALCVAANFIYSLDLFFNTWENLELDINLNAIGNNIFPLDLFFNTWENLELDINLNAIGNNIFPCLCRREIRLLFGEKIADYFINWFETEGSTLFYSQNQLYEAPDTEIIATNEEFLPSLDYKEYYFSVQDELLNSFTAIDLLLESLFFVQGQMLDKMNRALFYWDSDRLKYGHTFASVLTLLMNRNINPISLRKNINRWIDAQIDRASIVPQYICKDFEGGKNWIRVFRSGENEMHIISHWARLTLKIIQFELDKLGVSMLKLDYLSSLLTWIVRKYCLDKYSFVDTQYQYDDFSYSLFISRGKEKFKILELLLKMRLLSSPRIGYVAINDAFERDELLSGTILPDSLMENICRDLNSFHDCFQNIISEQYFLPFFDARLLFADYGFPQKDVLGMLFELMKEYLPIEYNKIDFEDLERKLQQCKAFQISNITHREAWFSNGVNRTDDELKKLIEDLLEKENEKGLSVLQIIIRLVIIPNDSKMLLGDYLKKVDNPKWNFLKAVVGGADSDENLRKNVFSEILKKGRTIWIS